MVIDELPKKSRIKFQLLDFVRDFLGHTNVTTTEVYARADSEMKRKALEGSYKELYSDKMPRWEDDENLMEWLKNLC